MPALVIPNNMAIVTCTGSGGSGDRWANVFALDASAGSTPAADLALIAPSFVAFYEDLIAASVFPSGWSLENVNIKENVFGGIGSADQTETTVAGGDAGHQAPQVAVVVSWKTALSGKSFRGRTYLGPLDREIIDESTAKIKGTAVSAIDTAAGDLRTALVVSGFTLVVWSRKLNSFQAVTLQSVGSTFDTMRSRRSSLPG